jgi:flavin-dependent dehydrogenase
LATTDPVELEAVGVNATEENRLPTRIEETHWDLLVVGAGPAGASCAIEAAANGLKVLLVDAKTFPRPKVCGGCLNRSAWELLERLGVAMHLRNLGATTIDTMELRCGSREGRWRVGSPNRPAMHAVSRWTMDPVLIDRAKACGVTWLPGTEARLVGRPDASRRVALVQGGRVVQEVDAYCVAIASGLASKVAGNIPGLGSQVLASSRVGLGCLTNGPTEGIPTGLLQMVVGKEGYVGMVQVEGGRINAAAAVDRDALRMAGSPEALIGRILLQAGIQAEILNQMGQWHGTPALTRQPNRRADHRLLLIGDAAGYLEPFTGEGMSWALRSGILAARLAIESGTKWSEAIEQRWERIWKEAIGEHRAACSGLARFVRHPRLLQAGLAICPWVPGIAQRLVNSVADRSCASLPKTVSEALLDPVTVSRLEPSWQGSEG